MSRANVTLRSYTSEDRRLAASLFAQYGSYVQVSDRLDIPISTIRGWQSDEEYIATLAISRSAITQEHIQRHLNNITLAQHELADRLENGNEMQAKDGSLVRIKVDAKSLAVIASIATQNAQLLQHRPTSIAGNIDARLLAIAETLARAARDAEARTVTGDVVSSYPIPSVELKP